MAGGHQSSEGSQSPGLLLLGPSVFSFSASPLGLFHLVCVVTLFVELSWWDLTR